MRLERLGHREVGMAAHEHPPFEGGGHVTEDEDAQGDGQYQR